MQKSEVAMLLTFVHSIQGGETTDLEVAAWFEVLGDLAYEDAKAAVRAHAAESPEHMKPAHIIARAKRARQITGGTMSPRRVNCQQEGREHRWFPDGTCGLCEERAL